MKDFFIILLFSFASPSSSFWENISWDCLLQRSSQICWVLYTWEIHTLWLGKLRGYIRWSHNFILFYFFSARNNIKKSCGIWQFDLHHIYKNHPHHIGSWIMSTLCSDFQHPLSYSISKESKTQANRVHKSCNPTSTSPLPAFSLFA